jgi:hypothetical protein
MGEVLGGLISGRALSLLRISVSKWLSEEKRGSGGGARYNCKWQFVLSSSRRQETKCSWSSRLLESVCYPLASNCSCKTCITLLMVNSEELPNLLVL